VRILTPRSIRRSGFFARGGVSRRWADEAVFGSLASDELVVAAAPGGILEGFYGVSDRPYRVTVSPTAQALLDRIMEGSRSSRPSADRR